MQNTHKFHFEKRVSQDVEETREIDFIISDESRDRHGDVVPTKAWNLDNFNKNGIVGYQHNVYGAGMCEGPDPDDVIASGKAFTENTKNSSSGLLIGRTKFEPADINEKAEKIFRKVLFGSLKATSVGFVETAKGHFGDGDESERGETPTYYFNQVDLIEYSIVNIPANANALRKSLRSQTANALGYIKRMLEGRYSFADIEKMCVGDVLKLVENPNDKTVLIGSDTIDLPTTDNEKEIGEHLAELELSQDKMKLMTL